LNSSGENQSQADPLWLEARGCGTDSHGWVCGTVAFRDLLGVWQPETWWCVSQGPWGVAFRDLGVWQSLTECLASYGHGGVAA